MQQSGGGRGEEEEALWGKGLAGAARHHAMHRAGVWMLDVLCQKDYWSGELSNTSSDSL